MTVDVMIVDDDRLSRQMLRRLVEAAGYSVRAAESGEQALELYAEKHPDVVLLDVLMPGIDGYETAARMKSQLRDQYVPILMLTGLTGAENLRRGVAAGADDFLSKPYNRPVIESRLRAALRTKQLFNSLSSKKAELQELNETAERDLHIAERVMARSIRSDLLSADFIRYLSIPTTIFNGDLLMAEATQNGSIRVMLGDFAGHGLTAAIGSQPVAAIFRNMAHDGQSVESFLQAANRQLNGFLPPELFLALCVVEINPAEGAVTAWNAGMPPMFITNTQGTLKLRVESNYLPLGIIDNLPSDQPPTHLSLEDGDCIYLHSDGLTEAMNPGGEEFGERGLLEMLQCPTLEGSNRFDALVSVHREFVGSRPMTDDVTVVELQMDRSRMSGLFTPSIPRSCFKSALTLGPHMLSKFEPATLIGEFLDGLAPLRGNSSLRFVLMELVNNGIDHGLLGLDSKIKRGPDGFQEFYRRRTEGLRNLRYGRIHIEVEARTVEGEVVLRVEDSGPGFAVQELRPTSHLLEHAQSHGRGIPMAARLCRSLKYLGNGNRVVAVLDDAPEAERVPAAQ